MPEEFDLKQWLEDLDLGQYAEAFEANEITRAELADLTDEDLRECGITALGHRKKLRKAIAALESESAPATHANEEPARSADAKVAEKETPDQDEAAEESEKARPPQPSAFDPSRRLAFTLPVPDAIAAEAAARRGPPAPRRLGEKPPEPVPTGATAFIAGSMVYLPPPRRSSRRMFWASLIGSKFLFVSILVHLLFGVGATYFIVQRIHAKRKVTFQGGPPIVDASTHSLEHKVSLQKKQKSGGAPAQAKRIVTAGLSKVSLPDLPSIPTATTVVPGMMAGLGGAGFGTGTGIGSGSGGGMGGGMGGMGLGFKMLPPALSCRCSVHERLSKLAQGGGSPDVEPAVARSLEWLKANQNSDGTWGSSHKAAMTGFALLSFFGRCATPDDPQYGETVSKGLAAIIEMSKRGNGLISTNGPDQGAIYEHGIATYALGEMLALEPISKKKVPALKDTFIAAVRYVISKQREDGGWRYLTQSETTGPSDLSVTGWQFQTLKAAKLNDLHIDGITPATSRVIDYMKSMQALKSGNATSSTGGFGRANIGGAYNQWALTGVGVLALQTLAKGGHYQQIQRGIRFATLQFRETPPNWESNCDLYSWYYYAQAFFQEGGKDWQEWNSTAMALVLANQNPDGTWKPEGVARHHSPGTSSAGADAQIYRTCLCTLILEVYYRYLKVG